MKIASRLLPALLAGTAPLAAQSFNLDCGSSLGVPASSYGAAAGQSGHWNVFDGETTNPFPLADLQGVPVAARFLQQLPFGTSQFALPALSGNDLALLGDYFDLASIPVQFGIANLEAGAYQLYVYAFAPDSAAFVTALSCQSPSQNVGGAWPGGFQQGITHARFDVEVLPGKTLVFNAFGFGNGTLNGLQLVLAALYAQVELFAELPAALAPLVEHEVQFTIDPRDEELAAAPRFLLRFADPAPGHSDVFAPRRMKQLGPTLWSAKVPAAACGETAEFFVEVDGTLSGVQHLPLAGAAQPFRLPVGYAQSEVRLQTGFAGGLPPGFTATGLWHVTGNCAPSPSCDGSRFLYYGLDAGCNYLDGTMNSGTVALPPVSLAVSHPDNASAELRFCSLHRTTNDFLGRARIFANGDELLELPQSIHWTEIAVDLTPYVGGTVALELLFEANHPNANDELGWMVDDLRVEVVERPCPAPSFAPGELDLEPVAPGLLEPNAHVP